MSENNSVDVTPLTEAIIFNSTLNALHLGKFLFYYLENNSFGKNKWISILDAIKRNSSITYLNLGIW